MEDGQPIWPPGNSRRDLAADHLRHYTVIPNGNLCWPGWNNTCPVCQEILDIPASALCVGKDTVVESWGFELDNCFSSVLGF